MNRLFYTTSYLALAVGLCSCNLEEIPDNSVPGGTGNASKFETSVGGNSNDFPNDAIAAADGGFIIVGYSQSFGSGNQAYIVKLDSKGKQSWEANFGGAQDDYAHAVASTSDGGFILCGRTRSFSVSQDIFLVKVSSSGGKVWEKFYGATDSTEAAFGIVPVGTSGDFLVGYTSDKGTGTSQLKFLRINANGTKVSNKLALNGKFGFDGMIKTSDSKIVIAGSDYSSGNGTVSYVVKFNEDGSFVWEGKYPAQASNYTPSFDVVELPDKSVVLAGSDLGSNDHDFNLVAYNQIGGKIWNKTWGGANADELFAITLSKDNQLVVMGYTNSFSGKTEFYLSKRKATDGNQIWERNFNFNIGNLWGGLTTAADGGFLLVGGENDVNADILVVKTNENGEYK